MHSSPFPCVILAAFCGLRYPFSAYYGPQNPQISMDASSLCCTAVQQILGRLDGASVGCSAYTNMDLDKDATGCTLSNNFTCAPLAVCPPLSNTTGYRVSVTNGGHYPAMAFYACQPGFQFPNGTWPSPN